MNFDFYEQFREYPNVELLKIIAQPGNYQPQAVEAAGRILQERNVTVEETEEAAQYFGEVQAKEEKMMAYKEKAKDFLQPVIQPEATIQPGKWLNILLLLVLLDYLWVLYDAVRDLVLFLRCESCEFDPVFFLLSLLGILYIPFIFFLLWKRKRWGWILLFADGGIAVVSRLSSMLLLFKYNSIYGVSITTTIITILIRTGFLIFLWRKEIADYFSVSGKVKQRVLIFLVVISTIALGISSLQLL